MRVVLDTNVIASALLWGGTPERLIEAAGEGSLECITSEALIAELAGILRRTKFAAKLKQKNLSAAEIIARYRELLEIEFLTPFGEDTTCDGYANIRGLSATGQHWFRPIAPGIVSATERHDSAEMAIGTFFMFLDLCVQPRSQFFFGDKFSAHVGSP